MTARTSTWPRALRSALDVRRLDSVEGHAEPISDFSGVQLLWVFGSLARFASGATEFPSAERVHHGAELVTLLRTGFYGTLEYVRSQLELLGFDDVRPARMVIFQHLRREGSRIGELANRTQLTTSRLATWSTTSRSAA